MNTEKSLAVAPPTVDPAIVSKVLLSGDLRQLSDAQKVSYYHRVCESVGLNPLTQPFAYLVLSGKEVLYARREATEQLRRLHGVSLTIAGRELVEDVYVVTARAALPNGRTDESIGAVPIAGLKGEARANAMMKAETKAKRRVTLAICGLGLLDESEVESIDAAYTVEQGAAPPALAEAPPIPADEPAPPEGCVRVMAIEDKPTRNKHVTKRLITFSTGEVVTTINDWLASIAQDALATREIMRAETKQTQYGVDLVSLKPADDPAPALPLEPLTDKDIPF